MGVGWWGAVIGESVLFVYFGGRKVQEERQRGQDNMKRAAGRGREK